MKNVLFIAMEFPPRNTTGAFRPLKFVKYLPEFGINPIVYTFTENSDVLHSKKIDHKLLDEVPETVQVYRSELRLTASQEFFFKNSIGNFLRIYFNTDDRIAHKWLKGSFTDEVASIINQHRPEAIYITCPPFSCYKIVDYLHCKYKNIPIILDMRDAWSQWSIAPYNTKLHYQKVYSREKKMFSQATKILGVTNQLVSLFQNSQPTIAKDKFINIPNGFDFELGQQITKQFDFSTNETIRIGYIGSFYYDPEAHKDKHKNWWQQPLRKMPYFTPVSEDWSYRSPVYFLNALSRLFEISEGWKNRVQFEHIGRTPLWLNEMIKERGLEDNFISHGFVSYDRVLELQENFDCFLATSEKVEGHEHYCLPSKLFDYIREMKPILAFLTEGSQKEFLNGSGMAKIFDPDNTEESAQFLLELLNTSFELTPNHSFLRQYHRRSTSKKLSEVINSL